MIPKCPHHLCDSRDHALRLVIITLLTNKETEVQKAYVLSQDTLLEGSQLGL